MAVSTIALDTNAYTRFKLGDTATVEVLRRAARLALPPMVLGELLGGFAAGSQEQKNREELIRFMRSPRVVVPAIGVGTANAYAVVYAALRRKGKPIPTNDLWIAATAIENGFALLTFDQHFSAIDGLIVGTTVEDFLLLGL